ncbi:MAG: hypothetical protein H7Z21_05075 [Hymenobacter sp.]|nr:hypothetical protein [Hymenobacter sp.]
MNTRLYERVLLKPLLSEEYHKAFVACLAGTLPILALSSVFFSLSDPAPFIVVLLAFYALIITAIITQCQSITIDFEGRYYRISTRVLGYHFGQWHTLPLITKIIVTPYVHRHRLPLTERASGDPVTTEFFAHERGYRVLLSVANSEIGIIAAWCSEKTALIRAEELSALLNAPIIRSSQTQYQQS